MAKKDKTYSESTIAALMEQHNSDLKAIKEYSEDIHKDMPGIKNNISEMKDTLDTMQFDIQIIKGNLKRKVDVEEFEALEKRVLFLEKKISRV